VNWARVQIFDSFLPTHKLVRRVSADAYHPRVISDIYSGAL